MSRNEVKEKIQSIIDKLNDEKLLIALETLKGIDENMNIVELKANLEKIIEEDENLLTRLAQ